MCAAPARATLIMAYGIYGHPRNSVPARSEGRPHLLLPLPISSPVKYLSE